MVTPNRTSDFCDSLVGNHSEDALHHDRSSNLLVSFFPSAGRLYSRPVAPPPEARIVAQQAHMVVSLGKHGDIT